MNATREAGRGAAAGSKSVAAIGRAWAAAIVALLLAATIGGAVLAVSGIADGIRAFLDPKISIVIAFLKLLGGVFVISLVGAVGKQIDALREAGVAAGAAMQVAGTALSDPSGRVVELRSLRPIARPQAPVDDAAAEVRPMRPHLRTFASEDEARRAFDDAFGHAERDELETALAIFRRLADAGYRFAAVMATHTLLDLAGRRAVEPEEIERWYRRALDDEGDERAPDVLARLIVRRETLRDGEPDAALVERARQLLENAAAGGDMTAELELGDMSALGVVVRKDYAEAKRRYDAALARGFVLGTFKNATLLGGRGRRFATAWLYLRALRMARQIGRRGRDDPRLYGVRELLMVLHRGDAAFVDEWLYGDLWKAPADEEPTSKP